MIFRSGGRATAGRQLLEESPGSTMARRRITSARGSIQKMRNPRDSATESKPPFRFAGEVRVKGCGKSAPRFWKQERQGKPRLEQDRIGTGVEPILREKVRQARHSVPSGLVARGDPRGSSQRNGRLSARKGGGQNPAYRPPDRDLSLSCEQLGCVRSTARTPVIQG